MRSKSMAVAGHDPGRAAIRALLLLLAGLLAATLALPAGPLSGIAGAQEEEQEEEAPEGPAITLLNPSGYGLSDAPVSKFRVVSDRDMEDHGYRLVATVHEAPRDAVVEFEAERVGVRRRLGTGSRVGDSFHLSWPIPEDFPRGFTYTFRAVMFSGGQELASDEHSAYVAYRGSGPPLDPSDPEDVAAWIDYPTSGGPWGLYQPPGGDQFFGIIDFTVSTDVRRLRVFYTTSAPGTVPEWTSCGVTAVSAAGAPEPVSGRHLCALAADDAGADVTGVAVLSNLSPSPAPADPFVDGSGDAVHVLPYRQLPVNVSLRVEGDEPGVEGPRQYEAGQCTNQISTFVTDQNDRPVARANVDIHASGPLEEFGRLGLRFDVSTGATGTDANQPPDQNHPDALAAWTCTGNTTSGQQGNHRRAGMADIRHIESAAALTNVDGRFRFRLRSDQEGGTQVTAWADADDDDLYCALEGAAHMSIGWGQAPPAVEGHQPERSSCDIPGLDEILEAQVTRHARNIGINFRRVAGQLEVRGRVSTRTGFAPCARNVPVRVQRRAGNGWQTLATVTTNGQRLYRARVADQSGVYRAVALRTFKGSQSDQLCQRAVARKRR